ncbi:MAG: hypothetical protein WD577_05845 [Bacteroidales bacterium]
MIIVTDMKPGITIGPISEDNASLLLANGNIHLFSTNGKTLVIEEGKEYNLLAENQLKGQLWATPAVYGHSLIIRTKDYNLQDQSPR